MRKQRKSKQFAILINYVGNTLSFFNCSLSLILSCLFSSFIASFTISLKSELPLESQELVYNSFIEGTSYHMKPQDWIDYRLGVLPHDKCKEYGLYSPDEKKAYYNRFPMCQYPVQIVYDDSTKGCRCPFGAFGKLKDGEVFIIF